MKRPLLFSRLLQFSIVLSFLFPFFLIGCEGGEKSSESAATDTTAILDTKVVDTSASYDAELESLIFNNGSTFDSVATADSIASTIENTPASNNNVTKDLASIKIGQKYDWLKPLLYSETQSLFASGAKFTGIGLIVNTLEYFSFISITLAFLLIISCLLSKFLDQVAIRTHLLNNILALSLLCSFIPSALDHKALWGYWVCIILLIATILYDSYRLFNNRSKKIYS